MRATLVAALLAFATLASAQHGPDVSQVTAAQRGDTDWRLGTPVPQK